MQTHTEVTSAIAERPLVCRGVPSWDGLPAIGCGDALPVGRRLCDRCDVEIERRVRVSEERLVTDERKRALMAAGLSSPVVHGTKSLDSVRMLTAEHKEARAALRRWINWTPPDRNTLGVLLRGDAGIGKTDLAEGAVRELVLRGRAARYVNSRALALSLQTAFRDDAPESAEIILAKYTARDRALWLVIDDVAATKTTRFVSDCFYSLLERRARDEMPTCIVTNYQSMADLAARLKPTDGDFLDSLRPVDRVEELAPNVITLRGQSLRATISREVS